jgi:phosphohistidine swiveling domain-containing protein
MDTLNGNNKISLVIKRQVQVEAISKAVYLVTDLFSDNEPLKMSLRRVAIQTVEDEYKVNSFLKLNSLIKLAREIDLITHMNADLLIRVIDSQLEDLNKKEEKKDIDVTNVLKIDNTNEIKVNEVVVIENNDIAEINTAEKVDKKVPTITINNNTQNIKTINNISMDIGSRRKRILEIVRSRGAVTINEFIDTIKGCSSKTIQRELTSLVLSGTLKKTGERRWSKYSLK